MQIDNLEKQMGRIFKVNLVQTWIENDLELVKVFSKSMNSYFVVAPQRGAIVVLLEIDKDEILFLNKETLFDKTKNIRGGIPILFPVCGRVVENRITFKNKEYHMNNHGFARDLPWEVIGYIDEPGKNGISLKLVSNQATRECYPYEFELVINYRIDDSSFEIEFLLKNKDNDELPFYAGYHPYFKCDKDEFTLELDCDRCFDDVEKRFVNLAEFKEIDFSKPEINLDFLNVNGNVVKFSQYKDRKIRLIFDSVFKNIVLWSQNGQDFVCVEPWMGEHEGYLQNKFYYLKQNDIFRSYFKIEKMKG